MLLVINPTYKCNFKRLGRKCRICPESDDEKTIGNTNIGKIVRGIADCPEITGVCFAGGGDPSEEFEAVSRWAGSINRTASRRMRSWLPPIPLSVVTNCTGFAGRDDESVLKFLKKFTAIDVTVSDERLELKEFREGLSKVLKLKASGKLPSLRILIRHPQGENPLEPLWRLALGQTSFRGRYFAVSDRTSNYLFTKLAEMGVPLDNCIHELRVWTPAQDAGRPCDLSLYPGHSSWHLKNDLSLGFNGNSFSPCCEFPTHETTPILPREEVLELISRGKNPVAEALRRVDALRNAFSSPAQSVEPSNPRLDETLAVYRRGCAYCKAAGRRARVHK